MMFARSRSSIVARTNEELLTITSSASKMETIDPESICGVVLMDQEKIEPHIPYRAFRCPLTSPLINNKQQQQLTPPPKKKENPNTSQPTSAPSTRIPVSSARKPRLKETAPSVSPVMSRKVALESRKSLERKVPTAPADPNEWEANRLEMITKSDRSTKTADPPNARALVEARLVIWLRAARGQARKGGGVRHRIFFF